VNEVAVFSSPGAGLRAAAAEAAASVGHLEKLIEGLHGAIERARLDGLGDEQIAAHFSVLPAAPAAVLAALTADGDGAAMRLLFASLLSARSAPAEGPATADRVLHPMGWG
jgi:hypothetical protein